MTETILVTGASGPLGRGVIRHLLDDEHFPPTQLIVTTRQPERLADLTARGVAVRAADFDAAGSLDTAFAGAGGILIISTDTLDLVGGRRLRQHEAAVAAAQRAGAKHIAYTSMQKPEPDSPFPLAPDHYGTEVAMRASGLGYTIFQPNAYLENLLTSLPGIVATGVWRTSAGDGRVAYAARDDMAAAIAGHLASATVDSATVMLSGPVAYTHAEVAAVTAEVTGRPITIEPLGDTDLVRALVAAGIPEPYARLQAGADANVRAGNADTASDVVERLAGRAPQSLRAFLAGHVAALLGGELDPRQ